MWNIINKDFLSKQLDFDLFQHVMAEHMTKYLEDMLYQEPVDGDRESLPSPSDLRKKILVGLV